MKKIIITALALMMFGGVASADRWRGHRDTSRHSGGTVVREHRGDGGWRGDNRGYRDRGYRDRSNRGNYRVHVDRRPVYVNNGYYRFGNGYSRVYHRPVIRQRYYDYRYRPQIIVQNVDPVPGYIWIQGSWNWTGYEWSWTDGYYAVDTNYSYDDGYYDGY